ncbi:MAG: cyclic nucleotide-binding domain-containing protein [Bdellovibrionales bacterium]|nr:cyclic nucleotide-binding domain-containing protein [Bdellovibrionales bacterium]
MKRPVGFEKFCPKLKKGKIVTQGRRLIYETLNGHQQIVLPIEMADVLLLSTGEYSMTQIIEKVFRRKGSVHFRTVFKSIHQLRDHNFLENGPELETHLGWSSPYFNSTPWIFTINLLHKTKLSRPHPMKFYFFSLFIITLFGFSISELPSSLIYGSLIYKGNSLFLSWIGSFVLISILISGQSILKSFGQLLLTGNSFGLKLQITPWGFFLKAIDEPVFLITNRLFLTLYHFIVIISPYILIWPISWMFPQYFDLAVTISIIMTLFNLSPFGNSELMRVARALFSLGQSDLVSGYLKDNSLLSLLMPVGQSPRVKSLKSWLSLYVWSWSLVMIFYFAYLIKTIAIYSRSEPVFAIGFWTIGVLIEFWVLVRLIQYSYQTLWPIMRFRLYSLRSIKNYFQKTAWSLQKLNDELPKLPLFSYFNGSSIEKLLLQSEVLYVRPNTRIITQGELGKHLFVLLDGTLIVERNHANATKERVSLLRPVTIFGEMAIVEESERTANVIVKDRACVLKIPVSELRAEAQKSQLVREIEDFCNGIMVNQFFTSAPMFRELSEDTIHDITTRSVLRYFKTGDKVLNQGDPGRSFFMVVRGHVDIIINMKPIKKVYQGGFFGEIALIADIPRTATVVAAENTVLLEMAAANFWEILCQNIELALFIEAVGESRLTEDLQSSLAKKVA